MKPGEGLNLGVDLDGNPISDFEALGAVMMDPKRRVGWDVWADGWLVSTVYVPTPLPVPWETRVFGPDGRAVDCAVYPSREDAVEGHALMVAQVSLTHGPVLPQPDGERL